MITQYKKVVDWTGDFYIVNVRNIQDGIQRGYKNPASFPSCFIIFFLACTIVQCSCTYFLPAQCDGQCKTIR